MIPRDSPSCYDSAMRNLVVLFIHLIATLALSIPKMLSGANAFEISDIQEERNASRSYQSDPEYNNVTVLHCIENLPPYQFARDRLRLETRGLQIPLLPMEIGANRRGYIRILSVPSPYNFPAAYPQKQMPRPAR